jgi:succinate-semialdehyde dehydrogenase/glutarate-semialdehyde dehydrogenase
MNDFAPTTDTTNAFIDGTWVAAKSGKRFAVTNPANGTHLADVADLDANDVELAIGAAKTAFASWSKTTAKQRCDLMQAWFRLIMDNQKELAELLSREQGKPLAEAMGEISYGASYIEWFAEEARRNYGDIVPEVKPNSKILVLKQPVGVVAAITPWNFPNAMIARKVAPALAAGCTIVIKPAPDTPLSAMALAKLADEAGIPKGVINVVPTTQTEEVGTLLTTHKDIAKVSFTGSTPVGRLIMRNGAETIKKLSLELGGNASFIVFDDADLDAAVEGAMASKFRNSGQTCVCANRIYVQAGIYDAFIEKLAEKIKTLKVGDAFEDGVAQGPLINKAAVDKVERLIKDATEKGAKVVVGGARHEKGELFYQPTLLRDIPDNADVLRDEIFGPVAPIIRFDSEQEAIDLANATEFGLASYFYARDIGRVWRVSEALQAGIIGVNEGITSAVEAPFGGVKQSGLGREGSKYGLSDYTDVKYVLMGGLG